MYGRLSVLLAVLAAIPAPALAGEAERIEYLNKKAMEDYDALEFDSARRTLTDCVAKLRAAGLDQSPVAARTYTHLGIVYVAGLHDKARGQKQFEKALAIDPSLRLDPAIATPELQSAWDAAMVALPRKKRQAAEDAAKQEVPLQTAPSQQNRGAAPDALPGIEPGAGALSHTPLDEVPPGQRVPVHAHPNVSTARVSLFYRGPGQEKYTEAPMGRSSKVPGDVFAYIPADALSGRSFQYYIEAFSAAGSVIGRQGSAESPFIVTVSGGAARVGAPGHDEEDPLANVRREQAAERAARPFREHIYFDVALGTGGAVIGSGTTTEVAWYYTSKPTPMYQPAQASAGGFIWSGLALRAEIGAYIYNGLSIGLSNRFELALNNNADSTNTPGACSLSSGGMSPCYATTSKVSFGYVGLAKVRYQFNRKSMFRPYVHFDVGGGEWRGGLNIDGSKPMASGMVDSKSPFQPTDQCSAQYNGMLDPTRSPPGCSSVGRVAGYNYQMPPGNPPAKPLNLVCPADGSACVDSVLLGYGMVGGGAGFYLGTEHYGVTVDATILGAFGGGNSGALIDVYVGPQLIF